MKINGVEISEDQDHVVGPYPVTRNGRIFGIYAQPIWDYDEFDKLCPAPSPAVTGYSKDGRKADPKSPEHLANVAKYRAQREGYTLLKSLEPSGMELDGISLKDPESWALVKPTLQKVFSFFEYNAVISLIDEACGVNSAKLEENRQSFLSQRRQSDRAPTEVTSTS